MSERLDFVHRQAWIEAGLDRERRGRRRPHVATRQEYLRFLRTVPLRPHDKHMLRAHAGAPDHTLTPTELARSAGYAGYKPANALYGRLGHKVGEFLDIQPPDDDGVWTCLLADAEKVDHAHGGFRWTMHPELVAALRELNMA